MDKEAIRKSEIAAMSRKELNAHAYLCEQEQEEYVREIESLRAEIQGWRERTEQSERQWDEAWHLSQTKIVDLSRERDEAQDVIKSLRLTINAIKCNNDAPNQYTAQGDDKA